MIATTRVPRPPERGRPSLVADLWPQVKTTLDTPDAIRVEPNGHRPDSIRNSLHVYALMAGLRLRTQRTPAGLLLWVVRPEEAGR